MNPDKLHPRPYVFVPNGEGNILDLVSPGLIPSRFEKEMKDIVRDLNIPLKLVCSREERAILIKASEAISLKQIETVIKSIMLVPLSDIKKAKEFREKRLLYIQSLLPHPSNIKYIEVISSQFHGLKLTV
ncbi:unnamed protein product [Mucor circinelloides]